jgi:hypothetical protein
VPSTKLNGTPGSTGGATSVSSGSGRVTSSSRSCSTLPTRSNATKRTVVVAETLNGPLYRVPWSELGRVPSSV